MFNIFNIIFFIFLSFASAITILLCGKIFSPKDYNYIKNSTFECGFETFNDDKFFVNPDYFVCALIFLVFNAQILLLAPFALAFDRLRFYVFIQAVLFSFILLIALGFAFQKNLLRFR